MTVRQSEKFQRGTFPSWNNAMFESTVRRFGIDPGQKIRVLSRGQRAGVSLALTLAAEPELLILDDPALGLDTPPEATSTTGSSSSGSGGIQ